MPTDEDGLDLDALERALAAGRPKFLYVIPNFGNPSGALMSLERRRRLLALAVRHDLLIVEDDPYGELYFDAPPPPSLFALSQQTDGAQGRVVYLGSLSKVVAPGLRVGWMIAPSLVLSNAVMVKQFADAHTSTFAQATAAAYLRSQRMETVLPRTRAAYAERAHAMADGLRAAARGRTDLQPSARRHVPVGPPARPQRGGRRPDRHRAWRGLRAGGGVLSGRSGPLDAAPVVCHLVACPGGGGVRKLAGAIGELAAA